MSDNPVINISEYTAPLKRYVPLIVGATIGGLILGFILFQTRGGLFVAEAEVQVKPIIAQTATVDPDRQINTTTEEEIASSQAVLGRALNIIEVADGEALSSYSNPETLQNAKALDFDDEAIQRNSDKVEVDVIGDSQILVVTASSDDSEEAAQLAQAVAVAYVDFRRDDAGASLEQTRQSLLERQVQIETELSSVYAGGAPAPFEVIGLEAELDQISRSLGSAQGSNIDAGSVISDATAPDSTEGLPTIAGPAFGALLGLIAGVSLALVLDRSDDRLRSASTEIAELGVPVLGTAPVKLRSGSGLSVYPSNSVSADSYRRVQATMLFNLDQEEKSLVVVSGVKNSRVSGFVAANLAAMAARSGRRTLLVGGNLRDDPLNDGLGLSDVVSGQSSLADAIEKLELDPNLHLLGGGTATSRPAEVLQSEAFGRMLNAVTEDYDLVLVDSPAVLDVADAVDISRLAQAALMVVDSSKESRKDIAAAIGQVRNVGTDIVGVVVAE